ncbi:MAG: UDP-galactopyranose mutase [Hungatella sp.]|nr:UDP-galactopyranose mutase [Hungatella sp.]
MYDYLIVGAGLAGASFARCMADRGKTCLVLEKRNHLGGNIYSKQVEGIEVHQYGPHIFHTDQEQVWEFVNRFASFNHFVYSPVANYEGSLYNLPFNMNTFHELWGVNTPEEARGIIEKQRKESGIKVPGNLEEQAIMLAGNDIYEKLVKGYTEKQWGKPCKELPSFIITRLPLRFTFDNNYFNHPHQGIPIGGYTGMVERMLEGIQVRLGINYLEHREEYEAIAHRILYTGPIDEYFGYCFGELEYRSLRFETEVLEVDNYQGVAGMNYTDSQTPFTRIIEHKHFEFGAGNQEKTIITREYPAPWRKGDEPYYPINDKKNTDLYKRYERESQKQEQVIFAGRLGTYQYYDMDKVIASVLKLAERLG